MKIKKYKVTLGHLKQLKFSIIKLDIDIDNIHDIGGNTITQRGHVVYEAYAHDRVFYLAYDIVVTLSRVKYLVFGEGVKENTVIVNAEPCTVPHTKANFEIVSDGGAPMDFSVFIGDARFEEIAGEIL